MIINKLTSFFKSPANNMPLESDERLWNAFLTARVALALILVLVQVLFYILQDSWSKDDGSWGHVSLLVLYLAETIAVYLIFIKSNLFIKRGPLIWSLTAALDLVVFYWLYWGSYESSGFFMLFMFSILMIATLGGRWLIYAACGIITLMVFVRVGIFGPNYYTVSAWVQGLVPQLFSCIGLIIVGELTRHLAARLRKEEHRATAGLASAKQQEGLNKLIVSEMETGVIVGDRHARLKMINPAALTLITGEEGRTISEPIKYLEGRKGWEQLQGVIKILFESGISNRWLVFDFNLEQEPHGPNMMQIKGRLLHDDEDLDEEQVLCVLFLTDLREVDNRLQQEKLAAMGRVSASIAHEIRNPLATIASANTLLSEGLDDTASLRLSDMITTNTNRLSQIVKDVLDVAHLEVHGDVESVDLLFVLPEIVKEWAELNELGDRLYASWPEDVFGVYISFNEEHLRRVMVNLLGNAKRYATNEKASIYVTLEVYKKGENEKVYVSVYSDGEALGSQIQRALFEPFFSTESRGTGLGLYICRNLCSRYDADLEYRRTSLTVADMERDYNEFFITANRVDPLPGETQVMLDQVKS